MFPHSENPYSPPNQNIRHLRPRPSVPKTWRIIAAMNSVLVLLLAILCCFVWATRNVYSIPDHPMFNVVFAWAVVLTVVAAYWMFYGVAGHKLASRATSLCFFGLSIVLTVLSAASLMFFFI